ncbi:MAG: hydroxymethylglutaryl-CoA reductase [Capsulimonadaceae bacterium]
MSIDHRRLKENLDRLLDKRSVAELQEQLQPHADELPPRPTGKPLTATTLEQHWRVLGDLPFEETSAREQLLDPQTLAQFDRYKQNIENFIGTVKVPVGVAGPLRVNGLYAKGDFYVPLATTEAALVASYHRGAQLLSECGGCRAVLLSEGVSRTPGFAFESLVEAGKFAVWIIDQVEALRERAETTTRHGKLQDFKIHIEGNHVYLNFEFTTGDAAGQNMVTIATAAICEYIEANSPVPVKYHFLEANMSGDKKASAQSFQTVRGKKVTAEATLSAELVAARLRTTPERMCSYWRMSALGGVMSGTIGVQGHYANGLAALYIACGQDAACVAESAVGVTRFEVDEAGALYAAVTLPNLMVGTVGGGTSLPSQRACLDILGLAGADHAQAFAEVCAAVTLAGELSIIGAFCSGDFARAHERLARARKQISS